VQELVDDTNSWCEELGIAPPGDAQVFFFFKGSVEALLRLC
jgi:hypothetical protein